MIHLQDKLGAFYVIWSKKYLPKSALISQKRHKKVTKLDTFFKVDMVTWVQMLQVFENKGFPEDEKNILKQKFLNMIGFLDGLYIERALDNILETEDE